METAGAEDIPEDAERKGLGTPATRAGIIEKLVQKGFMERKGDKKTHYLVSTDKGNALITVMPEQIQSASMTADWEQKLLRMERGDYEAEDFMKEITEMISRTGSELRCCERGRQGESVRRTKRRRPGSNTDDGP